MAPQEGSAPTFSASASFPAGYSAAVPPPASGHAFSGVVDGPGDAAASSTGGARDSVVGGEDGVAGLDGGCGGGGGGGDMVNSVQEFCAAIMEKTVRPPLAGPTGGRGQEEVSILCF